MTLPESSHSSASGHPSAASGQPSASGHPSAAPGQAGAGYDPQQGPVQVGDTFLKYELTRMIGRGGHAWVFEGRDDFLGRRVAIKIIHRKGGAGEDLLRRGRAEAKLLTRLRHPNIVEIVDAGIADGKLLYIVMELLVGRPLRDVLREYGRLSMWEVLELATQIAEGVGAAHAKGAIHRDLKPENVFVVRGNHVKVLDFGIAKVVGAGGNETQKDLVHGTVPYMAPEQLQGFGVTERTDIYPLGLMMYEALCGKHPCFLKNPNPTFQELAWSQTTELPPMLDELEPTIPRFVARLVQRALAKSAEQRFQSTDEMVSALNEAKARLLRERGASVVAFRELSGVSSEVADAGAFFTGTVNAELVAAAFSGPHGVAAAPQSASNVRGSTPPPTPNEPDAFASGARPNSYPPSGEASSSGVRPSVYPSPTTTTSPVASSLSAPPSYDAAAGNAFGGASAAGNAFGGASALGEPLSAQPSARSPARSVVPSRRQLVAAVLLTGAAFGALGGAALFGAYKWLHHEPAPGSAAIVLEGVGPSNAVAAQGPVPANAALPQSTAQAASASVVAATPSASGAPGGAVASANGASANGATAVPAGAPGGSPDSAPATARGAPGASGSRASLAAGAAAPAAAPNAAAPNAAAGAAPAGASKKEMDDWLYRLTQQRQAEERARKAKATKAATPARPQW